MSGREYHPRFKSAMNTKWGYSDTVAAVDVRVRCVYLVKLYNIPGTVAVFLFTRSLRTYEYIHDTAAAVDVRVRCVYLVKLYNVPGSCFFVYS